MERPGGDTIHMDDRTRAIKESVKAALDRKQTVREKRLQKRTKEQPWKVLAERYKDRFFIHYDPKLIEWGPAETSLAKKLLKEVELDVALRMVDRFIEWCLGRKKQPSWKLLWAMKDQFVREVTGTLPRNPALDRGEYDADGSKSQPKVGWGEAPKPTDEQVSRKQEKLGRDEYAPEESKKFPKIGWA